MAKHQPICVKCAKDLAKQKSKEKRRKTLSKLDSLCNQADGASQQVDDCTIDASAYDIYERHSQEKRMKALEDYIKYIDQVWRKRQRALLALDNTVKALRKEIIRLGNSPEAK